MREVKAEYRDGQVSLVEPRPVEVTILFAEVEDDPWGRILNDPTPRPTLIRWVVEIEEEIAQGKTEPMDFDML